MTSSATTTTFDACLLQLPHAAFQQADAADAAQHPSTRREQQRNPNLLLAHPPQDACIFVRGVV
jgi:hypothetical protein